MNKPHKHADVIKAWADGAEVQWRSVPRCSWEDLNYTMPAWNSLYEYRVKPSVEIPEGFIPCHGGNCPVDPRCWVEIILRRGATNRDLAENFDWIHQGFECDIIAYKVIKKAPVVRWQWIVRAVDGQYREMCQLFTEQEAHDYFTKYGTQIIGKSEWSRREFDE